jgi:tetraacyldisaccharide 4'-kinase
VRKGVEWIVLDDGFQHLQLARDADVVLIDAMNPFGGGRLLPAGWMREPKTALRRASIIVVTRSSRAPAIEAVVRRETDAPIFYARPKLDALSPVGPGDTRQDISVLREKRWFAFCGVGNPGAFVSDLRDWGFQICGPRFFRDHHRYSQTEMDEMTKQARAAGADGLICTEKDYFNLGGVKNFGLETVCCTISLEVDRGGEFWKEIESVVAISRSKRS